MTCTGFLSAFISELSIWFPDARKESGAAGYVLLWVSTIFYIRSSMAFRYLGLYAWKIECIKISLLGAKFIHKEMYSVNL